MLCRILEEIARKKGLEIKINQNPQKQFYQQRNSYLNQPLNIPPDLNSILIYNNELGVNDIYRPLINDQQQPFENDNNQTCCSKICSRIELKEPLYCFAYFLVMFYNVPFFLCEINYSLTSDQQACLDTDYGVGMNLRQWMFSSSIIGMSMYMLRFMVILWKILLPRRKKCSQSLTILNIICFLLKFLGYNLLGFVVYGNVDENGFLECSGSVAAYMEAILIIEIVIVCGLCSLIDRRR